MTGLAPGDHRHGTPNGYKNLGCRCAACREAHRLWARDHNSIAVREERNRLRGHICKVDGCDTGRKFIIRDYCARHLERFLRKGTTDLDEKPRIPDAECLTVECSDMAQHSSGYCLRCRDFVNAGMEWRPKKGTLKPDGSNFFDFCKVADGCVEAPWRSGIELFGERTTFARVAWRVVAGQWPHANVGRLCRNPRCVAPGHLRDGSEAAGYRYLPGVILPRRHSKDPKVRQMECVDCGAGIVMVGCGRPRKRCDRCRP